MILENDSSVLESHEMYFPELEEEIMKIKEHHAKKEWHQLSECMMKYMQFECLQKEDILIELYKKFIQGFEGRLNQQKTVLMGMLVADKFPCFSEAVTFLGELEQRCINEAPAVILLHLKQAQLKLQDTSDSQLFSILDTLKEKEKKCESMNDLDAVVLSELYKLGYMYYQKRGNLELFYKYALQYLAYTPEDTMAANFKQQLTLQMAFAVLLSKQIYNFSELLQQPVFQSLQATHDWIYTLLQIFNAGQVPQYSQFILQHQSTLSQYQELVDNKGVMEEKIKIMALLQQAFRLEKNKRELKFVEICKSSELSSDDEVERLVMKGMSLGLVKGKINQLDKTVTITWIIPQVLDAHRLQVITNKVTHWTTSLNTLTTSLQQQIQPLNS